MARRKIASSAVPSDYLVRPDVDAFIDGLVADGRFDRGTVRRLLGDARFTETSVRLMTPAAVAAARRDWNAYRARFVEPVRLAAGLAFWDAQAAWLAKAEQDFGVPPEIVVGILGCETVYGRNTGGFRVLDVLTTLSFDYPVTAKDRSPFFREQLVDALTMDREGTIDLTTLRGSYAGAIGMPQFMPGSIRRFAIDYDGDGRIDLVGSPADVIGSVANFLAGHGWVRGLPPRIALAAMTNDDPLSVAKVAAMVDAGSVPSLDFAQLAEAGFVADTLPPDGKLALIDLPTGVDATGTPQTRYLAGTQNFHVVTRYNRSYFYALSVIELGEAIKALRNGRQAMSSALR